MLANACNHLLLLLVVPLQPPMIAVTRDIKMIKIKEEKEESLEGRGNRQTDRENESVSGMYCYISNRNRRKRYSGAGYVNRSEVGPSVLPPKSTVLGPSNSHQILLLSERICFEDKTIPPKIC
uniref:Putative secreted peptide n=1 Tax=Anopheles braziliensis TaxID=58242 RepID=A0A2M3ZPB7_9DIPT